MLQSLPLLAVCFALGALTRRVLGFPPQTPHVLNRLVLFVLLPALVLKSLHGLEFDPKLALAASMMWLMFGGSFLLFAFQQRRLGARSSAALVLTGGLANTAFLGIPMIEGLLGAGAVASAVVVDQLGSFMVLSTAGLMVASHASAGSISARAMVKRLIFFPPFMALLVALATRHVAYPAPVVTVLDRLAAMMTPLALVSVGFQLELGGFRGRGGRLALGLAYRLVLAPLLVLGVFTALGGRGTLREVVVLQAAMAPMVTSGILATDHGLDPALATLMVGVGIPLSFLTIPAWFAVLTSLR